MNKVEALSAALQGQRVRSVAWNAGEYIEYDGNGFCDEHGFAAHLDGFRDVEWELFGVEPTTVNLEFDAPTEPIVLPFGHGILSIARGTTPASVGVPIIV